MEAWKQLAKTLGNSVSGFNDETPDGRKGKLGDLNINRDCKKQKSMETADQLYPFDHWLLQSIEGAKTKVRSWLNGHDLAFFQPIITGTIWNSLFTGK